MDKLSNKDKIETIRGLRRYSWGVPMFPEWEKGEMLRERARLLRDEEKHERPLGMLRSLERQQMSRRKWTVKEPGRWSLRLLGTFKKT